LIIKDNYFPLFLNHKANRQGTIFPFLFGDKTRPMKLNTDNFNIIINMPDITEGHNELKWEQVSELLQ
jgi:hypothetical protein